MFVPVRILFALLAALPLTSAAASFDCAKAASALEKLICSDPEISKLDEELAAAYRRALAATGDPGALRREQRGWLKVREICTTAKCLHVAYADRIAALQKTAATSGLPRQGSEYPLAQVAKSCLSPYAEQVGPNAAYKECRVRSVAALGRAGGSEWHAAVYCLAPREHGESGCADSNVANASANATAVLIFSQDRPDAPLRFALRVDDPDRNSFNSVRLHDHKDGAILDIAFLIPGTGNLNGSSYFVHRDGAWRPLDFESWQKDLHARLPKGLGVWKGPWPDLGKMVFTSPLWQDKDGNCCPTGGSVYATLGLEGTRLVVRSVKVDRKPVVN